MEQKSQAYDIKLDRVGSEKHLIIECKDPAQYLSLEDSEITFQQVINSLIEVGNVTSIILSMERNYLYPYEQTRILNNLTEIYLRLLKDQEILTFPKAENEEEEEVYGRALVNIRYILLDIFKRDPISAYLKTLRFLRLKKVELAKIEKPEKKKPEEIYVQKLEEITKTLEKTELIRKTEKYLVGYKAGDRTVYRTIFRPQIKPNFMYTRLMGQPPKNAREVDIYRTEEDTEVTVYDIPSTVRYTYHLMPPEFKLSDDEYSLLTQAREIIIKHRPVQEEFVDPERMREVFYNISHDLITQIAEGRGLKLVHKRVEKLAEILVRLTVGFGLIEILLLDENVEDVYINPPIGKIPLLLTHNKYGEMTTNIIPSIMDVQAWVSRFRMLSGRPLDEAHPVLDTELLTPHSRARAAIMQKPLSPEGYTFAFRKHRPKPWTLPLFIQQKMISSEVAGLLWFLIDGARTLLVAGTRGSGKTSLLGSLIVEIMRKYRIITVEDTLELPIKYLQKLGYDIVPIKVRSAIQGEQNELSAADGIRTTLRLGDSALIVGEVRSLEALALYEAMRVGALANVVAGTIHGDSPYGIFDRVVNDLGVPKTSFKATDIIVIANKIRSPDGLHDYRRVLSVTELRKDWEDDPMREQAFVKLADYDAKKDQLKLTQEMIEGESEILKGIAARVKEWAGNWDRVYENIQLRGRIKQLLTDYATKANRMDILESDFQVQANDQFHRITEKLAQEQGYATPKRIETDFELWLKTRLRKK